MGACGRDRVVKKRADLRDSRRAGNIYSNHAGVDVGDRRAGLRGSAERQQKKRRGEDCKAKNLVGLGHRILLKQRLNPETACRTGTGAAANVPNGKGRGGSVQQALAGCPLMRSEEHTSELQSPV